MRTASIVLLTFLCIGCRRKPVSFHDDVQPILVARCINCHGNENPAAKIALATYDNLMNSKVPKWKKPIVIPGDPTESWLYLSSGTNQAHFRMPPDTLGFVPLTEKEVDLIGKWIQQGAKNN